MTPPRRSVLRAVLAALAPAILLVSAPGTAAAAATDQVWIRFDAATVGQPITMLSNSGTLATSTTVKILSANNGSIVGATSYTGGQKAGDFPAFDASSSGPRAIISITNKTATDNLNPGTQRIEFGADVKLDAGTTAGAPDSTDNGNNVIQRGLAGDPAQFKLQIDGKQPNCRVKGASGMINVSSLTLIEPETQWFRVHCVKVTGSPDTLTIQVTPIADNGMLGATTSRSNSTPTVGAVNFASAAVPVSVGGKLLDANTIYTAASDQFNGVVDNAVVKIG